MRTLSSYLVSFARDRGGNFAITTGLIAVLLAATIGGVADYSRSFRAKVAAQKAADAAALAGSREMATGTIESAEREIQMIAAVNMPSDLADVTFRSAIDQNKGTVTVTASGVMKPGFLPLASINTLSIGASATSSIQQKQYIDFYFMLDVSESMNIAASEADRIRLETITKDWNNRPCAFACHAIEPNMSLVSVAYMNEHPKDNYGPARLRIDVARDAANGMIDRLLQYNSQPDGMKSIRVATAGFGVTFLKGLTPSTNAAKLKNSLQGFGSAANSHTDPVAGFAGFGNMIGTQGDGSSQTKPSKMALVLTDGVRDSDPGFRSSGLGPFSPAICDAIKKEGITLAVLEIKYVANYSENFFRDRVSWYYPQISSSLDSCASPGFHFLATDSDDARNKLLAATDALLARTRRLVK